ncbi:MAG: hypothetical protein IT320_18070 [Anaerolineae bacterium]|nr:hypothetical protein [Anaerolineae bacterium]
MVRNVTVILIVLILALAACSSAPASPTVTSTPSPQPLPAQTDLPPTATPDPLLATLEQPTIPPLATYTSAAYGFSFQYPVTSSLEETPDGQTVWIDKQIRVTVSDQNPEAAMGDGPVIEAADSTIVNGMTARRLSGMFGAVGGNTPQRFESIVLLHNNRYYGIWVYELRNDVLLPIDRELSSIPLGAMEIFNTMLATFTFSA